MGDPRHAMRPVATLRPRGAPRLDAFSLKLNHRLTLFQRGAPELWLLIEVDPTVRTFCERPGYVRVNAQRRHADFWVCYSDHQELVFLSDSFAQLSHASRKEEELDGLPIRSVTSTDLAAAHVWIYNWRHMLPCLVAACGLVSSSLLHAVETFVAIPHTLIEMKQRRYADAFDYPHLHVDASQGARGAQIQALYKYESLLDILTRCADGTLVLLLSANAVIVNRVPLASMLADRPYLIVRTESECQQTDVQIWRNSQGNRDVVRNIVRRARLGGERFDGEARLLNELGVSEFPCSRRVEIHTDGRTNRSS